MTCIRILAIALIMTLGSAVRAQTLNPGVPQSALDKCDVYHTIGDCTTVIDDPRETPQNKSGAYQSRAAIYRDMKDYKSAIDDLTHAIAIFERDGSDYGIQNLVGSLSRRAELYLEIEDRVHAKSDCDEAVRRNGGKFVFVYCSLDLRDPALMQALLPAGGSPADIVLGSDKAPLTIIQYGSMTCDGCTRFVLNDLPAIKRKYIDSGQVRFILREVPTDAPALDVGAFMLAHCANDKAMALLTALHARKNEWYVSHPLSRLKAIAEPFGVDVERCLGDQNLYAQIQASIKTYEDKLGSGRVGETYYIGPRAIGYTNVSASDVKSVIDRYLK